MSKPPLGSGERFQNLKERLAKRLKIDNPSGLAAYIGRKKFGKSKFQEMASKGK